MKYHTQAQLSRGPEGVVRHDLLFNVSNNMAPTNTASPREQQHCVCGPVCAKQLVCVDLFCLCVYRPGQVRRLGGPMAGPGGGRGRGINLLRYGSGLFIQVFIQVLTGS